MSHKYRAGFVLLLGSRKKLSRVMQMMSCLLPK